MEYKRENLCPINLRKPSRRSEFRPSETFLKDFYQDCKKTLRRTYQTILYFPEFKRTFL